LFNYRNISIDHTKPYLGKVDASLFSVVWKCIAKGVPVPSIASRMSSKLLSAWHCFADIEKLEKHYV